MEWLLRVTGVRVMRGKREPFCAGAIVDGDGKIREVAPILHGCARGTRFRGRDFVIVCRASGWRVEIIPSP